LEHHIHPIEETKMFKNRFLLILGILSMLLVTTAISRPFANVPVTAREGANDFYESHTERNESGSIADFALRHPEWTLNVQNAVTPVAGVLETADYFLRHPELKLSMPAAGTADLTDYFIRHPGLRTPNTTVDRSDYFLRH
jgi:hypothetical protein